MMFIHIVAGSIGILSGFAAMLFAKGSARHRLAGRVYVVAMLVMTTSAFIAAAFLRPNRINVLAAMLTCYLVATAWMTLHRRPDRPALLEYLAMVLGGAACVYGFAVVAGGERGGMAGFGLFFGGIAGLCVVSDLRFMLRGVISRTQALARHVWRMGFSLAIASGSLFLGQMKHLPAWLLNSKLNVLIALTPLVLLVFWLVRVRFPPWRRKTRAGGQSPLAPAR